MDMAVIERPLTGLVCELPQMATVEHRAANRAPEGWVLNGKNMERQYHGRSMKVEPLMVGGKCLGWFKWLDQHYRGLGGGMESAEHDLEREAENVRSAWAKHAAWEAAGSPERRRQR